jgi:hypothetical protein
MSRRWFWPLLIAAMLLFSLAAGFLWSVLMLYGFDGAPELPRRVSDYSETAYSFDVEINPATYVIAVVIAAVGAFLVVVASRLR